jgi:hypothetical protein
MEDRYHEIEAANKLLVSRMSRIHREQSKPPMSTGRGNAFTKGTLTSPGHYIETLKMLSSPPPSDSQGIPIYFACRETSRSKVIELGISEANDGKDKSREWTSSLSDKEGEQRLQERKGKERNDSLWNHHCSLISSHTCLYIVGIR